MDQRVGIDCGLPMHCKYIVSLRHQRGIHTDPRAVLITDVDAQNIFGSFKINISNIYC